jgi:hypothetical protein
MDEIEDDDERVLRDGETLRRSLLMMDAHKPGVRVSTDEQQRRRDEAYDQMVKRAENSWRTPQRVGDHTEREAQVARSAVAVDHRQPLHDGMGAPAGYKPGYAFTGAPVSSDIAEAEDRRRQAYEEYVRRLSWKTQTRNPDAR